MQPLSGAFDHRVVRNSESLYNKIISQSFLPAFHQTVISLLVLLATFRRGWK